MRCRLYETQTIGPCQPLLHYITSRCKKTATRDDTRVAEAAAEQQRKTLFGNGTASRRPQRSHPRAASDPYPLPGTRCVYSPFLLLLPAYRRSGYSAVPTSPSTSHSPPPPPLDFSCPGSQLAWTPGPVYETFPLHLFSGKPHDFNFNLARIEEDPHTHEVTVWLRSSQCRKQVPLGADACAPCMHILASRGVASLIHRASTSWKPHMRYEFMTRPQLQDALRQKSTQLSVSRTEVRPYSLIYC